MPTNLVIQYPGIYIKLQTPFLFLPNKIYVAQ